MDCAYYDAFVGVLNILKLFVCYEHIFFNMSMMYTFHIA